MQYLKKISECIVTGMVILASFTQCVYADETVPEIASEAETSNVSTDTSNNPNEDSQLPDNAGESNGSTEDTNKPEQSEDNKDNTEQNPNENPGQSDASKEDSQKENTVKPEPVESNKKEEPVQPATPSGTTVDYDKNTWYHPDVISSNGYTGEVKNAIKLDNFVTGNWDKFKVSGNPFALGQCTYFAWSRFYQVYGYDSGARGNGKTNAAEIVRAHSDKFKLSSTPAAGAVFSYEKNSLLPQYGHVGFVEAYDEMTDTIYISEGNVSINGTSGNIYIHKMKFSDLKKMYPDIVFAVPNKAVFTETVKEVEKDNAQLQTPVQKKVKRKYSKKEWERILKMTRAHLYKK